jgi:hypothetical protein
VDSRDKGGRTQKVILHLFINQVDGRYGGSSSAILSLSLKREPQEPNSANRSKHRNYNSKSPKESAGHPDLTAARAKETGNAFEQSLFKKSGKGSGAHIRIFSSSWFCWTGNPQAVAKVGRCSHAQPLRDPSQTHAGLGS